MEYDDSPMISPVASLVSSRTESPEFPAESPPNSLPTQPQGLHSAISKLPKPKWLWKSARSVFPFIGRRKLDRNTAMDGDVMDGDAVDGDAVDGDAVGSDFMVGDVRIAT